MRTEKLNCAFMEEADLHSLADKSNFFPKIKGVMESLVQRQEELGIEVWG